MPLLEITQTRQISASIRLTDTVANQVDQYAAFIHASADDVVEQALAYVFSKDRDFQDFLRSPEARQVASTLRIRKAPVSMKPVTKCLHYGRPRTAFIVLLLWRGRRHDMPSTSAPEPLRCFAPEEY